MARRVVIVLEDDLTGGLADETVTFALEGKTYEIDLSNPNAKSLRQAMAQYVNAGRELKPRRGKKQSASKPTTSRQSTPATAVVEALPPATPAEIRAWARNNGVQVPSRGRIPKEVREGYQKAHSPNVRTLRTTG